MPIKKSKAITKSRKFKKSRKSKSKLNRKYRNSKKNRSRSRLKHNHHKGGASCDLVTVSEPGFNVDALGSMAGLSIASSTAAIYRPNCAKNVSSQAMAP